MVESSVMQRLREGLLAKRRYLTTWLASAPGVMQETRVGPAGLRAVEAHIHVLDSTLQKAEAGTLGLCRICHEPVEAGRLELDYTTSVCLDHFTEQEKRGLESELELSQVVQRALLPQSVPAIPGLEMAAFSRPAQLLGGDYFDFYRYRDGAFGLAIADVAGHGVSAGLLMASVQTALRAVVPESSSPGVALERVNRLFGHNIYFTTFVTLFLGRYEPEQRRLSYANAGHNPPLLRNGHRDGKNGVLWLEPTAPAIGLVEEASVCVESVGLARGDTILLYTDGVTEATDPQGEQFGQGRLAAFVSERADMPAKELVRGLWQELQRFADNRPLADDTTIVAGVLTA
jgi:sigma-B regulation protein RsbU (phosphoserine phosphatase)